jgi:hypothetical protein
LSLALTSVLRELFFEVLLVLMRVVYYKSTHLEVEFVDAHYLLNRFHLMVEDWLSNEILVPLETLNLQLLSES